MNNKRAKSLGEIVMAPYIQKASALIGYRRKVGGNQFRHAMTTMAILIDYNYIDPILLKASVVHDLLEDTNMSAQELSTTDEDGLEVVSLVLEVTRKKKEQKRHFLNRILKQGSNKAKVLKVADRISNLTDLHHFVFDKKFIEKYVIESEEYVLPMAIEVNENMAKEMRDLIEKRRQMLQSLMD